MSMSEMPVHCPSCLSWVRQHRDIATDILLPKEYPFCSTDCKAKHEASVAREIEASARAARRLSTPRLMILGHARHGKDTVSELFATRYNLSFVSSSFFVAERAVQPYLAAKGIEYPSLDACYADRVNHRADWFNAIADYNSVDPARLGRELFAEHDIYCGLRSLREFSALYKERAFDVAIWVDRSNTKGYIRDALYKGSIVEYDASAPVEPRFSCSVTPNLADFVLDNNGSLDDLSLQVDWAWEKALRLRAERRPGPPHAAGGNPG